MTEKANIANSLEMASEKSKCDEYIKQVLANKEILAWIVKYSVKEFEEYSIEEILESIEGNPLVSKVPIYPGKENTVISGMNNEDKVPNEGERVYDIRFFIYTRDFEPVKLIMNLEAQNTYNPGYPLIKRGIFYGARMISSQLGREFYGEDYSNLKKVYSIWICMNVPRSLEETITEYSIKPTYKYGTGLENEDYDMLSVVKICMSKKKSENKLIHMLNTIFSSEIDVEEKKKILQKEYNIKMTYEMDKEMEAMCNFSEGFYERGFEKGLEQGLEQVRKAKLESVRRLMEKKGMSAEEACEIIGIELEEFLVFS